MSSSMYLNSTFLADVSYKIIMIGDSSVGKSALIHRFKHDAFFDQSRSTVGVEFTKRIVRFKKTNQNVQIHLWDTAGQERYKSLTKQHYRGADGALVIFDFSQPKSFESIIEWCNEVKENTPPECILCIVGNKVDMATEKTKGLSKKAMNFAKENKMLYFETSCQWTRTETTDRYYAKGVENIILDMIENVSVQNPRKALGLNESESLKEHSYASNISQSNGMRSITEDISPTQSQRTSYRTNTYMQSNTIKLSDTFMRQISELNNQATARGKEEDKKNKYEVSSCCN